MKRKPSNSPRPRGRRSDKEIVALLKEHRRSGLSLLAFARTRQLCYSSLLRWRSRHRQRAKAAAAPDKGADPRFVGVQLQSETWSGDFIVDWPGGRSLRIPPGFEAGSLRQLLEVLEGLR